MIGVRREGRGGGGSSRPPPPDNSNPGYITYTCKQLNILEHLTLDAQTPSTYYKLQYMIMHWLLHWLMLVSLKLSRTYVQGLFVPKANACV